MQIKKGLLPLFYLRNILILCILELCLIMNEKVKKCMVFSERETLIKFTEKEISIIKLICEEKSSKEIGELLFLSARTIERIRSKILDKMKVKTPAGMAIYAIKNNLYN